jgi:hypothetical protein
MSGVFINYRGIKRSFAPQLIDEGLSNRFGAEQVFEAGRSNRPASDIPTEIDRWLITCSVLIAIIDKGWIDDIPLLSEPTDWVRKEIQYALAHSKHVIPVLLDGVSMPKARELPPEIAPLTKRIALWMEIRTARADLLRLIGEVERLAPDLVLASLTNPPLPPLDPGARVSPTALLRPEYGMLPFRHRAECDQLVDWCGDADGPSVYLVTGPAGAGKTRLGLQLCAQLRGTGWSAGLLSLSAPPEALARLGEITTRCLVVIDDAEARPAQVGAALRALATTPASAGRLLLLARSGGDWLDRLADDEDDHLASLVEAIVPLPLVPLRATDQDFDAAFSAFAPFVLRSGEPVPPVPANRPAVGTVLEAQAAALAHLMQPDDPAAPLARILQRERSHWRCTAATFGLPDLSRDNVAEIMTVVALFGATTEPEADGLLAALRTFRDGPVRDRDACRAMLRTLLPGTAPLNPMTPEQIAEDTVAGFLRSGRSLSDVVDSVTDPQLHRALIVLGRCLERYPDLGEPVTAFLARAPGRILPLAMTAVAALRRPELLAQRMYEALGAVATTELGRLVAVLPQRSEALARFALAVTEGALAASRENDIDAVATARLSRLFATRLGYLRERAGDAIEAAQHAVDRLTALADTAPDLSSDLHAELAEAYATLATALDLDPCRGADAMGAGGQAIARYRALPDGSRRDAGLAQALHHQSIRLTHAGDAVAGEAAAVEAYQLTGPLDAARPVRYRSLHTDIMDNRSTLLTRTGQLAAAERLARETLARRRTLAASRPDAYRPQLAGTLFNLGLILSQRDGHQIEVRTQWAESLAIFEDLAERWPDRFTQQRDRVREHLDRATASADHLARLCFEGSDSTGRYTPRAFSLHLRGVAQPTDHVVYLHEVHHAALNDVTEWGSALHVYARLPDAARRTFAPLLDACRVTHESLATFASMEIARARHGPVDDVLLAYPDYVPLYEATVRLLAGVEGAGRRQLAATALARVCMQTPVLEEIRAAGLAAFDLARLREIDCPDGRWSWFRQQGPELLLSAATAADRTLVAAFGAAALDSDRPGNDLYQSTERTHDDAWDLWEASAYEQLRAALDARGARTMPVTGHQEGTAAVLALVNERYGDIGLRAAMTDEQRRSDASVASSVLQQVRHELGHGDRYRAMLLPSMEAGSVVEALADRPVIDGRPAVVVDARPARRLAALYRWQDNESPAEAGTAAPIVAVRMSIDDGTPGIVIGHAVLPAPEALAALAESWGDRGPLVGCVSASCLADAGWARRWVPPFASAGPLFVLVDVEPERFVPGWVREGRAVIAVGMDIDDTGGRRAALFFTRDDSAIWWLVLGDDVTVRLMGEYLRGELGSRLRSEPERLGPVRDAARVVVSHLLATESFVGFDGLGDSDVD